ncbi:MAG: hypothetical protein LBV49_08740 [Azonexus sp.]|jgi:hypothetical protein|nr:hypothetical protein [Azonexus sp.]
MAYIRFIHGFAFDMNVACAVTGALKNKLALQGVKGIVSAQTLHAMHEALVISVQVRRSKNQLENLR